MNFIRLSIHTHVSVNIGLLIVRRILITVPLPHDAVANVAVTTVFFLISPITPIKLPQTKSCLSETTKSRFKKQEECRPSSSYDRHKETWSTLTKSLGRLQACPGSRFNLHGERRNQDEKQLPPTKDQLTKDDEQHSTLGEGDRRIWEEEDRLIMVEDLSWHLELAWLVRQE